MVNYPRLSTLSIVDRETQLIRMCDELALLIIEVGGTILPTALIDLGSTIGMYKDDVGRAISRMLSCGLLAMANDAHLILS